MSKENQKLNKWAIGCLDIQAGDHVLEIGYGAGYSMLQMLKGNKNIYVDGADASEAMAQSAKKRLKHYIDNGKARVMIGKAESLYLPEDHYDKVLSVNNFTIWEEPDRALQNLYASLKKGGRIVIMMQPREEQASPNMTRMMGDEIFHALTKAGFQRVSLSYRRIWPELSVGAVGFK